MWRNGKTQTETLFLQFMQCSLYNDCFLHFRYGASIHFKPILWKNGFLPQWNNGLKWIKHLPKENHHSKTWLLFLWKLTGAIDVAENEPWVVVIKLSSKFSPFFQIWHQLLFILRIALPSDLPEIRSKFPN